MLITLKELITKLDIQATEKYCDDTRTMCMSRRATPEEESLGITRVHSYPIVTSHRDIVGFMEYLQKQCYLMDKVGSFSNWCVFENRSDDSIKALEEYKKWMRHVQGIRGFFGNEHYYEFLVAV